jgi:hypothetical protein
MLVQRGPITVKILTFKAIMKDWRLDDQAQLFKEEVGVCMELMRLTSTTMSTKVCLSQQHMMLLDYTIMGVMSLMSSKVTSMHLHMSKGATQGVVCILGGGLRRCMGGREIG